MFMHALRTSGLLWLLALTGLTLGNEPGLIGKWISQDHKTTVALAPCLADSPAICATILDEQTRPQGERSRIGEQIGVNFLPEANGRWVGEVVDYNGTTLPATLTMPRPEQFDMRVCVLAVLCDGATYFRAKP